MVTKDGKSEHYTRQEGDAGFWHHSYIMKNHDAYYDDSTLRYLRRDNEIEMCGGAVLDPYGKGVPQIEQLASELLARGVPDDMPIRVAVMHSFTEYDNSMIGTLRDWAH